jgi:styrene monooxygenase A-like protein
MRRIAVIGSGQAGLLAAHGLLRAGHDVTLYSDRTAEDWLDRSHPTGTAVRFARSLAWERELGLDAWHAEAPQIEALKVLVCSAPAAPFVALNGRFTVPARAIDLRLQSAHWMEEFERRGGRLIIERATLDRIAEISRRNHLTLVATGKEGGALFRRDPERSARAPLRHLAMVNLEGPPLRFGGERRATEKFVILEGLGECFWTPYFHKERRPIWNLVIEAKPGTALDRFRGARSGAEVLYIAKGVMRELMPWAEQWIEGACLADVNGWLVGAVTPVVRDPIAPALGGGPVIPLGDAFMAFDPLAAQGANMGNRLSRMLVEAIAARKDAPFDEHWIRKVYRQFSARWGEPAMRWTQQLLEPMKAPARYLILAQEGATGDLQGGSGKQDLADAFAASFDDPTEILENLADLRTARRWVAGLLRGRSDWEVAKALFAVGGRQLRNALSS